MQRDGHRTPLPRAILVDPNDGCLTIARALARRGVEVTALTTPASSFVGRSRFVDHVALRALPAGASDWVAALSTLGSGVAICGSDAAVELLCTRRPDVPAAVVSFESATGAHLTVMDKSRLYALAERAGIRAPWSRPLTTAEEAPGAAPLEFPCVLKPALSHTARLRTGRSTPVLVRDAEELRRAAAAYRAEEVDGIVVEYVPGPETALEGAVVVRCADGGVALAYTRRKLRQYPLDFGAGSILASHTSPDMLALARRLLDAAGYVGLASVEAKRSAATGELVLIEVNTRVPQNFGLGDACGADASWRLYSALAALPLGPQPGQRDGVSVLIPRYDVRAAWSRWRRGELTLRTLLREYATVRDAGVLDLRDPAPLAALARVLARERVRGRRR